MIDQNLVFDEVYKNLNDEQRTAVDSIDGPMLVLAGPGTGKTQLLSARVANILCKSDAQPQNILCLTFTDAAAYNMRERLAGMIGEAAYDVHINTYHSFSSDVIKTYPEYFESIDLETGQDSRMERPIDAMRQLEIVQSIVQKLPFSDPLRSARYYIKSVLSTISDCKQAALEPNALRAIAKENHAAVTELSPIINALMEPHGRIPSKPAVAISLFEDILSEIKKRTGDLAQNAATQLETALQTAQDSNKTKPLTDWKNKWLVKDENDAWSFTNPASAEKLESLSRIYEQYQHILRSSGQYDFNDMILKTIDALKNRAELRYNLQEKYQYVLLDEFQDTNAAQFELVQQLVNHPVHEGRPNIMAVGDDDQGIFAFQGADIGNMVSFMQSFRNVLVINLVKNYRSHTDILHVAHNIAEQIESRLHHGIEGISKDIVAVAQNLPPKATIARHEFASQASECGWIAHTIAGLIEKGTPPHEIAILAPKHVILESMVPFLNTRDIPASYEKRENIFDAPIVQAIYHIAEFLESAHRQDMSAMNVSLPKVLSLDFWGIPTKDIWEVNWDFHAKEFADNIPWPKLAMEKESMSKPVEFLLDLGAKAETLPLETILDYITGAKPLLLDDGSEYLSPMKSFYFSEHAQATSAMAFYEAISHLSVIRSHVRDLQVHQDNQLKLSHLISLRNMYEEAEQPLINTHPVAQSDSAVQLLTVYKAKGMEYEYVFLPSMHDDIWGSTASSASNKLSLPNNLLHIRHDASTEDTRRRLLFVAISRAKHGLYATSFASKENGKKTLPVKYFLEAESNGQRSSGVLPGYAQNVIETIRPPQLVLEDVNTLWHSRHVDFKTSLKSLLCERLQRYVMSPTHLNAFTNLEYCGPESFLLNTLLRFPEAQTPDSIYGDCLHRSLEWLQKQGAEGKWHSAKEVVAYFLARLERTYLSQLDKQVYGQQGAHALTIYLAHRMEQLKTSALAEVDFRSEGVVVNGAVLTGKIDRLEIDKKRKTVRIIDFKSGSPSTKWSSQSKYINYKQQLYFYHLLIEKSHTYKGFTVEQAALEFIEPQEDNEVAPPLILPFDVDEYNQLKALIVAVWQRIQNLDLPNTSEYQKTAAGTRQFIASLLKN